MKTAPDNIRFVNLPEFTGISAVLGIHIFAAFPRHAHASFCIGTVDSGVRAINKGREECVVSKNRIFLINPGEAHSCRPYGVGGHNYRIISIQPENMSRIAEQLYQKQISHPWFEHFVIDDCAVMSKFNFLFKHITSQQEKLGIDSALLLLLSDILAHHSLPVFPLQKILKHQRAIEMSCDFMHNHYNEKISLAQLSRIADLSPIYFQKVFVKEKGLSPHDYLFKIRINKATELLMKGWSVVEVAIATGFTDQSHFTRHFKRHVGVTPGKFAKEMKTPFAH